MRAAAIQLNSTEDAARNRAAADRLVRESVAAGATLVVLPEKWNRLGDPAAMAAEAESLDGPSTTWARELARELGIDLVAGSILERDGGEVFNTSVHVGPGGEIAASYRKLHLFDVEVEGTVYRESDHESPGEGIVTSALADGTVLGLSVCYDLRFPELYRALAVRAALIFTVPSAFTVPTTRDHWEVLVRARAIEDQCFVIAANQWGTHAPGLASGGRSLIADPWGIALATAADGERAIVAELDLEAQSGIRARLPALESRRPEAYGRTEEALH